MCTSRFFLQSSTKHQQRTRELFKDLITSQIRQSTTKPFLWQSDLRQSPRHPRSLSRPPRSLLLPPRQCLLWYPCFHPGVASSSLELCSCSCYCCDCSSSWRQAAFTSDPDKVNDHIVDKEPRTGRDEFADRNVVTRLLQDTGR